MFTDLVGLGFTAREDSQYFSDIPIDGSVKYELEGGLIMRRKRFTRDAGRHIITGFSFMSQANKTLLDNFFQSMHGSVLSFTYRHPTTGENLRVFFEDAYKTTYQGVSTNIMWHVTDVMLRTTLA